MFSLRDGRSEFYQWDINRQLIVNNKDITQVHFCNRTDECSLVVNVIEEDGLHIVNVPNILLQDTWKINVFGYDTEYTKYSDTFKVLPRSKPADYVYTEVEIFNYHTLVERMNKLEEEGLDGVIADEVYVGSEAPTDENIKIWVDTDAKGGAAIDFSAYALKTDIPDVSGFITEVPSEYITETELASKGYLTEHQSLEGYATAEDTATFVIQTVEAAVGEINAVLDEINGEVI